MRTRDALSVAVIVFFSALVLASSKPKGGSESLSEAGAVAQVRFESVRAAAAAPTPGVGCTDALLDAAAKGVRVPESWQKVDKHDVLLVDQPVALRFTRQNAQQDNPEDGWRWVNAFQVRDLNPESYQAFEHSDSKVEERILAFAQHPLIAVLRADVRTLPKASAGADGFDGGKLSGKLVLARTDTGAPVCQVPISAASSTTVKWKERGLTGKSMEKALLDDFKSQVSNALDRALKTSAPSFKVTHGT